MLDERFHVHVTVLMCYFKVFHFHAQISQFWGDPLNHNCLSFTDTKKTMGS